MCDCSCRRLDDREHRQERFGTSTKFLIQSIVFSYLDTLSSYDLTRYDSYDSTLTEFFLRESFERHLPYPGMAFIALGLLLFAPRALSQYTIESSSFGHHDPISRDGHIPGFYLGSDSHQDPQILSDRIALTPAYYGNRRGAIWADAKISQSEWVAELDFRASGPERGGGNLQIWYTRDGRSQIGTNSIYTVGRFDGLALVVDMYGGHGGSVRGFMNDGSTDYKAHHAVDSLAFGHCDFSYRNLGRPASIKIRQDAGNFEVLVEERRCFASDKIKLPSGDYGFGITAGSAEIPDSFELYKFLVTTAKGVTREEPYRNFDSHQGQVPPHQDPTHNQHQQQQMYHHIPKDQHPQDIPASQLFGSSHQDAQFEDLHNRLQFMSHGIDHVVDLVDALAQQSEGQHQEVARNVMSADRLEAMDQRIRSIEQTVKDYQEEFRDLHRVLRSSHHMLGESLTERLGNSECPFIVSSQLLQMGL